MRTEHWWNDTGKGKKLFWKETCLTNLTGTDLGSKMGLTVTGWRHIACAMARHSMKITLTLRLLMSYIYIYICIYIYIYMERLFLMFLDHTQRRSTVGRTPLDE